VQGHKRKRTTPNRISMHQRWWRKATLPMLTPPCCYSLQHCITFQSKFWIRPIRAFLQESEHPQRRKRQLCKCAVNCCRGMPHTLTYHIHYTRIFIILYC